MKRLIQKILSKFGYTLSKISTLHGNNPGSVTRPIGLLILFLEDVQARGFVPRGILDIGAHNGDWTRSALSVFPNTPVLMLEPLEEMEKSLSEFTKTASNCRYIKAGVGRKAGELDQIVGQGDLSGSSFIATTNSEFAKLGKRRKTRIITIDEILSSNYPQFLPDLVKLDIQGFELEALSGADTLFGNTEIFILEVSLYQFLQNQPLMRDVISFMLTRGYEVYDIPGFGRRPLDGALGQLDLAFVKANGQFRQSVDWE